MADRLNHRAADKPTGDHERQLTEDSRINDKKGAVAQYRENRQAPGPVYPHQNRADGDVDQVQKGKGIHRPAGNVQKGRKKDYIQKHDQAEKPFVDNLLPPGKRGEKQIAGRLEQDNCENEQERQGDIEVAVSNQYKYCLAQDSAPAQLEKPLEGNICRRFISRPYRR